MKNNSRELAKTSGQFGKPSTALPVGNAKLFLISSFGSHRTTWVTGKTN
jgi:hypothetical protein